MSRPSYCCFASALVLACLLARGPAAAGTLVVRPDGTGDVPTFQAGVDSLAASGGGTLLAEAGDYSEDVVITSDRGHEYVVDCPSGASHTRVRSLKFSGVGILEVRGLAIATSLVTSGHPASFVSCQFEGPVSYKSGFIGSRGFSRCLFRDRTYITGSLLRVEESHFEGPLAIGPAEDGLILDRCSFTGQDTAVTFPYAVSITACTFTDARRAIVGLLYANRMWVTACVFSRLAGPAISVVPQGPDVYHLPLRMTITGCRFDDVLDPAIFYEDTRDSRSAAIAVSHSRFESCAGALRVVARGVHLQMAEDTLVESRGDAIHADASGADSETQVLCQMSGVLVDRSGGTGLSLRGVSAALVQECTFSRNKAGGVFATLEGAGGEFPWAPDSSVDFTFRQNTVTLNGGPGITIAQDEGNLPSTMPVIVDGNIFAGNEGSGAVSSLPYAISIRNSSAWMNVGRDYVGLADVADNLTLDPQFCDPLAGDFRVASLSPCAPSGPYGQIGALGVGCDAMAVPVDVEDRPVNLRANAPVEAAILAHRLFDPRTVDVSTVRLAGAPLAPRGRRGSDLRDVNQDGLTDLLLSFDARDLRLEGGEAQLQGRTRDGAPFRGADAVEVKSLPLRAALGDAATVEIPSRLALSVQADRGVGEVRLLLDLPSAEPARIEVFDVAGRRLQTSALTGLGPGRHVLVVRLPGPSASGLYLLRLWQGGKVATGRVAILE